MAKQQKETRYSLPYYVSNGGDGSASVRFCKSDKDAQEGDGNQCEGWGESSSSDVTLVIKDGKLFYEAYDWNTKGFPKILIPVPIEVMK